MIVLKAEPYARLVTCPDPSRGATVATIGSAMGAFLYRCPGMGLSVRGWIVDDPANPDHRGYEAVSCPACARVHYVNAKTGKVLGERDKD